MKLIKREIDKKAVKGLLRDFPVVAIIGPRQCGKTTLAGMLKTDHQFDLENPKDMSRLDQPLLTLEELKGCILIDEIQRKKELFPLLRYLTDTHKDQQYLILGSASPDLIKMTSESLAGRIAYYELGGLTVNDVGTENTNDLWFKGSFPKAYIISSLDRSMIWRINFIQTFLERDIPQLGINIPSRTLYRFWNMVSHYHGQILNYSELAASFGISDMTVRRYIEILEGTFMVRVLQPWYVNIGKRQVKHPKLYLRDSGILHALFSIHSRNDLLSHPKLGTSWEGFALEALCRHLGKPYNEVFFWHVHNGPSVDLFWQARGRNWGAEFKYKDAPRKSRSMGTAVKNLGLSHFWVVYPGEQKYKLDKDITVLPFHMLNEISA